MDESVPEDKSVIELKWTQPNPVRKLTPLGNTGICSAMEMASKGLRCAGYYSSTLWEGTDLDLQKYL